MNCSKGKGAVVWLLLIIIFIALTPNVFEYADKQRGYDATGGEILFPLIPLVLWLIVKTIKDFRKD